MPSAKITTREQLHAYLVQAMRLEHATIPPYLTALYSIRPGTNADAFHILRVTVVEEMLHLTLVANLMNAVGGDPDLTAPGFVPEYPAGLPDGETDFQVSRRAFSREALESFLSIERPRKAPDEDARLKNRGHARRNLLGVSPNDPQMQFYSIGEFYHEIWLGLHHLHAELGDDLFSGDPARQVGPEYFYSGGGSIVEVTDLHSARKAIELISEQGEGFGGGIYDDEHELAHYYRFMQLTHGRYYRDEDTAESGPTGPELQVDWNAAYPIKIDAALADYPPDSELHAAAVEFNAAYADFLGLLTRAYTGEPSLLIDGVVQMFRIRDLMTRLMHNPIPGRPGVNGAPTFEVNLVPAGAAS